MSSATTQVQRHFQRHSIYKRSKHYFDIQKMNQQQHMQQIYRRKPVVHTNSIETLDTRVDQSFVNAAEAVNKRLQHDISQFKKRYQDQAQTYTNSDTINRYQSDIQQENYEFNIKSSRGRIKAPDLMKMTGRRSFAQNRVIYNNQAQFNNFQMKSPRSRGNLDFSLLSPRSKTSLNIENPEKNKQIQPQQIGRTKQKNNFNNSVYKCLFEYSKINKYGKQSLKKKTQESMKVSNYQKIQSAQKNTKVNAHSGQSQFYLSVGKNSPSQMNYRYTKQNENCLEKLNQRINNQDYTTKKRKSDMIQKRFQQILKRKSIKDERGQLCDYKYFNRQSYRKQ